MRYKAKRQDVFGKEPISDCFFKMCFCHEGVVLVSARSEVSVPSSVSCLCSQMEVLVWVSVHWQNN